MSCQISVGEKNSFHTKIDPNCGLFIVKIIECHWMGIEDMSKLRDESAEDIRTKLAFGIFKMSTLTRKSRNSVPFYISMLLNI